MQMSHNYWIRPSCQVLMRVGAGPKTLRHTICQVPHSTTSTRQPVAWQLGVYRIPPPGTQQQGIYRVFFIELEKDYHLVKKMYGRQTKEQSANLMMMTKIIISKLWPSWSVRQQ